MTAPVAPPVGTAGDGTTPPARERPRASGPLLDHTLLLGATLVLIVLGSIMVLSASSVRAYEASGSVFSVWWRQAVGLALGLPLLFLASRVRVVTWRRYAPLFLVVSLFGLLLVLVPGIGVHVDGSRRWVDLGFIQLQPSEPAKLALVLWGTDVLVRKARLLGDPRHLLVPIIPVVSLVAVLVMLQPDLGTTIVLLLVAVALLWHTGAPTWLFAALGTVVTAAVTWLAFAAPYRRARITAFLDPFADPLGSGYQSVQGLYALSSGGWFGLGLGASREKWSGLLPNAHTDFVFAIVGEELGLLGTLIVVVLFGVIAWAGMRVSRRAQDPFARLAAAVLTTVVVGQAALNMATVVGLAPITGIPLPFMSYGNTALLVSCTAMGALLSFARTEPGAEAALAARRRGPLARALHTRRRQQRVARSRAAAPQRSAPLRRTSTSRP